EERIDFDKPTHGIECRIGRLGAVERLLRAHARDPAGGAIERASERLDLAHPAASLPRRNRRTEAVDAVLRHERFDLAALRVTRPDAAAIARLGAAPQLIGLRKQPTGIERDDIDW